MEAAMSEAAWKRLVRSAMDLNIAAEVRDTSQREDHVDLDAYQSAVRFVEDAAKRFRVADVEWQKVTSEPAPQRVCEDVRTEVIEEGMFQTVANTRVRRCSKLAGHVERGEGDHSYDR